MKKCLIFYLLVFSYAVTNTMEIEEIKTGKPPVKNVDNQELADRMANFVDNLYHLRQISAARTIQTEDFIGSEWRDLEVLHRKVKKRCSCSMPKLLKKYHDQTKSQIALFSQGISLLDDEEFTKNVRDKIEERSIQTFFTEKFCQQKRMTPTEWCGLRTIGLSTLREKLKEKTTKEQIIGVADQAPSCVSGFGCGVGFMALFTPLWPYGVTLLGLGSCICLTSQHEIYDACKSHGLYCSNRDIDQTLERHIQRLQFDPNMLLKASTHNKHDDEKERLLEK